jgi:two-component system nitrogen regulation response regulator GlnG
MRRLRILHVDDDEVLLRAVQRALRLDGFEVRSVATAAQAEAELGADSFDALLVDIDLVASNGLDLVERVQAMHPELPVLILSGQVTASRAARAEALGVVRVFHKPASMAELGQAVRQFTGVSDDFERSAAADDDVSSG